MTVWEAPCCRAGVHLYPHGERFLVYCQRCLEFVPDLEVVLEERFWRAVGGRGQMVARRELLLSERKRQAS